MTAFISPGCQNWSRYANPVLVVISGIPDPVVGIFHSGIVREAGNSDGVGPVLVSHDCELSVEAVRSRALHEIPIVGLPEQPAPLLSSVVIAPKYVAELMGEYERIASLCPTGWFGKK